MIPVHDFPKYLEQPILKLKSVYFGYNTGDRVKELIRSKRNDLVYHDTDICYSKSVVKCYNCSACLDQEIVPA